MGNPASVKRKLKEKRRARHEQRLGPGAYLPKAEREQFNKEYEAAVKAALAEKAERAAARKAAKAAKAAAPAS